MEEESEMSRRSAGSTWQDLGVWFLSLRPKTKDQIWSLILVIILSSNIFIRLFILCSYILGPIGQREISNYNNKTFALFIIRYSILFYRY